MEMKVSHAELSQKEIISLVWQVWAISSNHYAELW